MAVKYFAYASNMAPEVMAHLCPRHRYLGVGRLNDYRLAFTRRSVKTGSGVADIIEAPGQIVWGALYEIDDDEIAAIDRKEGHGWAYVRVTVPVELEVGRPRNTAITYVVRSKESPDVPPSREYLCRVIEAAHARGLPGPYIEKLEAVRTAEAIAEEVSNR